MTENQMYKIIELFNKGKIKKLIVKDGKSKELEKFDSDKYKIGKHGLDFQVKRKGCESWSFSKYHCFNVDYEKTISNT